jgi:hypothetical protein
MLQIDNLRFLPSGLGGVFWGEGLYFCIVGTPFFGDDLSPTTTGLFAALVMMYYRKRLCVVSNNEFVFSFSSQECHMAQVT